MKITDQQLRNPPSHQLAESSRPLATLMTMAMGQNSVISVHSVWVTPCDASLMRCARAPAKFSLK